MIHFVSLCKIGLKAVFRSGVDEPNFEFQSFYKNFFFSGGKISQKFHLIIVSKVDGRVCM
jgi:hypothetical protein